MTDEEKQNKRAEEIRLYAEHQAERNQKVATIVGDGFTEEERLAAMKRSLDKLIILKETYIEEGHIKAIAALADAQSKDAATYLKFLMYSGSGKGDVDPADLICLTADFIAASRELWMKKK